MTNRYFFRVAGLPFAVSLPGHINIHSMLPSFAPFRCEACAENELLFSLTVSAQPLPDAGIQAQFLGSSANDMGHVSLWRTPGGYRTEIYYGTAESGVYLMDTEPLFSRAAAFLPHGSANAAYALTSMLRILYAQAVLPHGGVSIHASCVSLKGRAYLFLGKSGTGKSTHARQWMAASPYCRLLNDDNPVLRIEQGRVVACGSPWSGKTPCYINERRPVAGIVRLQQAPANRFAPLADTEAFAAMLPSCSAIRHDARLQDALCHTLIAISELVPVGRLECRPDTEAAWTCYDGLKEMSINK